MNKIKITDTIPYTIRLQGAPLFGKTPGFIRSISKNCLVIEIDLRSKYCQIEALLGGDDVPGIYVGATDRSVSLKRNKHKHEPTGIEFPTLKGWNHFCSDMSRYTLRICFLKK